MYEAITGRDYVVIQGFTLVIAIIYVTVNLLVDISYGVLDPRVRLAMTDPRRATAPPRRGRRTDRRVPASLWRDTLGGVLRQRSAVVGLVILAILVFVAVFAPLIATHDPDQVLLGVGGRRRASAPHRASTCSAAPPTSRSTSSAPTATSGTCSAASCTAPGRRCRSASPPSASRSSSARSSARSPATSAAGSDNVLMRVMDVILAFPSLLLAIAIVIVARHRAYTNALLPSAIVVDADLCPDRARVGHLGQGERLRHRVARARRIVVGHPHPADHAERAHAAHRAGHARDRHRRPRDRRPVVRRGRRPSPPRSGAR